MSKTKMVEVIIDSVRVSLTNQQRIVVLRDINAERYLPIWIGPYEAESITIALQEIEVSRPQTHDLIKNILLQLNARLIRVEVLSLKDDVFYGTLIVDINGDLFEIDSRPSDALALAARTHAKILVSEEVMQSAGIVPEVDIQDSGTHQEAAPLANTKLPDEEISEERLSVFEDFLGSLDIGDIDDDEKPEDDSSDKDEPKN
jgi:bifunctional DNase/RNase